MSFLYPTAGSEPEPSVTWVDDYERSSLDYYTVDTDSYSIVDTRATSGTRSVTTSATNFETIFASEGGGLPNYPSPGDTISMDIYGTSNWGIEFNLARQDSSNRCMVTMAYNEKYIENRSGGTTNPITYSGTGAPSDQWFTVSIDWPGDMTVGYRTYDQSGTELASDSGTLDNALIDTGNFALVSQNATGGEVWVDAIRIGDGPL